MGRCHPNFKLVKIHRNYSVEDLAKRLNVHANTIRGWRDQGMSPIDDGKPILFHGSVVAVFLRARRASGRQRCEPGQIYCLPCHAPKFPALRMAEYVPLNGLRGNLEAMCPDCGRMIYRAVSRIGIEAIKGNLEITIREAARRISD
jgi:hypothetical protein